LLHLLLVADIGGEEVGADEQEDDLGGSDSFVESLGAVGAGQDHLFMGFLNGAITFELGEMIRQLLTPG
jgi:hypothetical protein